MIVRDQPGLYPLLLALDGLRDLDQLRRHVRRQIPELRAEVDDALAPLIAKGCVIDATASPRPHLRVELAHDGPSTALAHTVGSLLADLGVDTSPEADLVVLLSSGEPDRATLAEAVRCGVSHLPVVLVGESVRIGPLVVPGRTPCVECTDRHRTAWDPAWLALVPQFGRPLPCGVSATTQYAAAAEIAAVCVEVAGTDLTEAARRVVVVDAAREVHVVAESAFHPQCSCALLSAA